MYYYIILRLHLKFHSCREFRHDQVSRSRLLIRICIGKCLNSILGDRVSYAHVLSPVERVTSVWDPDPINVSIRRPKTYFSPSRHLVQSDISKKEWKEAAFLRYDTANKLISCKKTRVNSFNERSSFLRCYFRNVLIFNSLDSIASFSQL